MKKSFALLLLVLSGCNGISQIYRLDKNSLSKNRDSVFETTVIAYESECLYTNWRSFYKMYDHAQGIEKLIHAIPVDKINAVLTENLGIKTSTEKIKSISYQHPAKIPKRLEKHLVACFFEPKGKALVNFDQGPNIQIRFFFLNTQDLFGNVYRNYGYEVTVNFQDQEILAISELLTQDNTLLIESDQYVTEETIQYAGQIPLALGRAFRKINQQEFTRPEIEKSRAQFPF